MPHTRIDSIQYNMSLCLILQVLTLEVSSLPRYLFIYLLTVKFLSQCVNLIVTLMPTRIKSEHYADFYTLLA